MERLKKFNTVYKAVLTAGFSAGAININEYLTEQKIQNGVSLLIIVILLVASVKLLEFIGLQVIGKFFFIRKLICGKNYIEGAWVDIVFNGETKEVLFGGIVLISYENGEVLLSGASYDPSGRFCGSFKSTMTKYSNYRLSYTYRSRSLLETFGSDFAGSGVYDFIPEGEKSPELFTGYFIDTYHKSKTYQLHGEKLSVDVKKLTRINKIKIVTDFIKNQTSTQRYFLETATAS